jgi:hypothetical protein
VCGVEFVYAPNETAEAMTTDVGRGGMRVRLGRYLRPGTKLLLRFPVADWVEFPAELKAEIVWCGLPRRGEEFAAGLRIIYDEPEVLNWVSRLIHDAIFRPDQLGQMTVIGGAPKSAHRPRPVPRWQERGVAGALESVAAFAAWNEKRPSGGPEAYREPRSE